MCKTVDKNIILDQAGYELEDQTADKSKLEKNIRE